MSDLVRAAQSGAVAQGQDPRRSARDLIERYSDEFARALGAAIDTQHFVRSVLTVLTNVPKLQESTEQSLVASVLLAAQLRLEVGGGLNQFHLTPRTVNERVRVQGEWVDNYQKVCVPIIGYQGFVELAYRNQKTLDFNKIRVHEGDEFEEGYSSERGKFFEWRPPKRRSDRGALAGVLVSSRTLGGGRVETYLTMEEIEARRPESSKEQTVKGGARRGETYMPKTPWATDYPAMADKTVVREHAKLMPKSIELQRAIALDERVLVSASGEVVSVSLPDEDDPSAEQAAVGAGAS